MPIFLQFKCAGCAAEQEEEEEEEKKPVQLWDCGEYIEPTCVQTKCAECAAEEEDQAEAGPLQLWDCSEYEEPTCVQTKCAGCEEEELQHRGRPTRSPGVLHREARRGLAGASEPLPHVERIQAAFGHHDVSHVRARVGGDAGTAAQRMGAQAFASGDRIGFLRAPDLRLSAHEAAHTVQQREGLSLPNNVGRPGDRWERHADQVADAVVEGRSAEPLLDKVAEPGSSVKEPAARGGRRSKSVVAPVVQRQITSMASRLFEPPVEAPEPVGAAAEATSEPAAGAAESGEQTEEEPAIEAAEGDAEAPPEGVPAAGQAPGQSGAPASAAGGEREGESGGGISAPCYNVDPPPRREDAPEPSSDNRGSAPQQQAQVVFEAWPDEIDDCPAEEAVAEGSQQIPAVGASAGTPGGAATPAAGGGAVAAAPAAAEGGPPASAPAEGGAAPGGGEAQASSPAATADSGMEGLIGSGEAERNAAVSDYLASTAGLGSALTRSEGLESGVSFPAAGDSPQAEAREAAIAQTQAFMKRAADQIGEATAFVRDQVPARLGQLAENTKAAIQGGIETEKAAISDRIAQARAQARAGARAARAHVNAEYASSAEAIESVTLAVLTALDSKHQVSLGLIDEKEISGLDDVNSRFATGRTQHETKGPEYAARALARGQEHAHAYERCKGDYSDDGFWDGCLTVRRAKAQQDAACKTAAGYKDVFLRTANKKGYDLRELRKQYRCAVIAGARQVNQTLDSTHGQLTSGLESGRGQAMNGITLARDENLRAIDSALTATLRSLADQEFSQRQAVNDTGYLKQLAVEQMAHASAAGLTRGVSAAMESLGQTLAALRERLAEGGLPDPAALAQSLAVSEAGLSGGMGTLLATMEEGAQQSELRIQGLGAAAIEALALLTASSNESTAQAESGFAQQMEGLKTGASDVFSRLTSGHVEQAGQALEGGTTSMDQAVAGFDTALGTIGGRVDEAIATSLGELDRELGSKLGEIDGQITREAWKAAEKEQPAWKSVVAIVLVILVIIAAAVISIVTLGAGASLFAIILVGALVGAVSAGLIQVINNWASGEAWHTGLAQAMIMGAIGGAIGGGLGFAGGALASGAAAAGARVATQFAITVGADLVAEGVTQTIGYVAFGQQFNWQGFVMAGAMSGVSFRAHPSAPRGGAPRADVPTPSAAGAAGGRRAAVAQIAGGAALGLGLEYAAAVASGKKFDLTQAASAAASGAVGARMARRGGPTGPAPEPTTRLGRAAERVRSFDPGGVGARLQTGIEGLGGRAFGPRPEVGTPAAARPQGAEAGVRPVEEPDLARPRTTEEPGPTRPPPEEPEAPRRPADESGAESETRAREVVEMHPDSDLAAPGASRALAIGDGTHSVSAKRTSNGEVVLTSCSNCAVLRDRLRSLAESLPDGPAKQRALDLANAAAELQTRINKREVSNIAGETRALADRVSEAAQTHPDLEWSLRNLLEGREARPATPRAPEPGGRIDATTGDDFAARTGGTGRGGWFEPENALSPSARANPNRNLEAAREWYERAKTTGDVPALGDFNDVRQAVAARAAERAAGGESLPPALYRLDVPQDFWQLQVNDAWIAGHVERGSSFEVVSNPTARSNLETTLAVGGNPRDRRGDRVQSVFGRELQVLERHGYRFVQDAGPRNPASTRGISGRMVPPSEVATLEARGYVWMQYETPAGHFEGITGRWVRQTPAGTAPR